MGGSESQLRGGFRNFVSRGHGKTTSWHGIPFWRTVTVSFGCHTTHIVNIESTAFECSVNTFRSQPRWLALVRFRLQYLGWRSTSLGLGELTLGSCGNAFGVKNRTASLIRIVSPERPRPGWLTITHIFCRHTLLQTNSQRESPSHLWEGRSLSSGEGLRASIDEAMARRHLGETTARLAGHYANRPISN